MPICVARSSTVCMRAPRAGSVVSVAKSRPAKLPARPMRSRDLGEPVHERRRAPPASSSATLPRVVASSSARASAAVEQLVEALVAGRGKQRLEIPDDVGGGEVGRFGQWSCGGGYPGRRCAELVVHDQRTGREARRARRSSSPRGDRAARWRRCRRSPHRVQNATSCVRDRLPHPDRAGLGLDVQLVDHAEPRAVAQGLDLDDAVADDASSIVPTTTHASSRSSSAAKRVVERLRRAPRASPTARRPRIVAQLGPQRPRERRRARRGRRRSPARAALHASTRRAVRSCRESCGAGGARPRRRAPRRARRARARRAVRRPATPTARRSRGSAARRAAGASSSASATGGDAARAPDPGARGAGAGCGAGGDGRGLGAPPIGCVERSSALPRSVVDLRLDALAQHRHAERDRDLADAPRGRDVRCCTSSGAGRPRRGHASRTCSRRRADVLRRTARRRSARTRAPRRTRSMRSRSDARRFGSCGLARRLGRRRPVRQSRSPRSASRSETSRRPAGSSLRTAPGDAERARRRPRPRTITMQPNVTHSPYRTYGVSPVVAATVVSTHRAVEQPVRRAPRRRRRSTAVMPEIAACTTGRPVSAARICPIARCWAEFADRRYERLFVETTITWAPSLHERPHLVAERRLEADDRADPRARDVEQPGACARARSRAGPGRVALIQPLEQPPERHVLAERHEVALRVRADDRRRRGRTARRGSSALLPVGSGVDRARWRAPTRGAAGRSRPGGRGGTGSVRGSASMLDSGNTIRSTGSVICRREVEVAVRQVPVASPRRR